MVEEEEEKERVRKRENVDGDDKEEEGEEDEENGKEKKRVKVETDGENEKGENEEEEEEGEGVELDSDCELENVRARVRMVMEVCGGNVRQAAAKMLNGLVEEAELESWVRDPGRREPGVSRQEGRNMDGEFEEDEEDWLDEEELARLVIALTRIREKELTFDRKLAIREVPDLGAVVDLIADAHKVVILSGAGVSVSCGIPDFRSPGGLYDTVRDRFGLAEPQALFDIEYFRVDPTPFFEFAREILPSVSIQPSLTHHFIRELAQRNKLLRNYSQNIDGLEELAGIKRVITCHGSFATASCRRCGARHPGKAIRSDVEHGRVPYCKPCLDADREKEEDDREDPILKPDIVFFGEPLSDEFFEYINEDIAEMDLLIVLGTSLKVAPVAKIPASLANSGRSVPQILINRELVGYPFRFDVELLGNCDTVVQELMRRLAWNKTGDREHSPSLDLDGVKHVPPNRFIFPGGINPHGSTLETYREEEMDGSPSSRTGEWEETGNEDDLATRSEQAEQISKNVEKGKDQAQITVTNDHKETAESFNDQEDADTKGIT